MKNLQSKCKLSVVNNGNGSFCSEITYNLLTQVQLEEWLKTLVDIPKNILLIEYIGKIFKCLSKKHI